jgi:hypothetical protein
MTHEPITESEFVSEDDEMQTADSYAVNDMVTEDDDESHPMYYTQPNLLSQILGFFFQTPARRRREQSRRLNELNVSIEFAPNSPTNYVLRGELFLERREYHLAQADFEMALELADAFDPEEGWGLVEQVMRDRALDGLVKVQRGLS